MQSVIVNCCKIILVSLVLVSCGKSKEDEKLFEELNHSLENSNAIIKKIHVLAKEKQIRVPDKGDAGNPIHYYQSLIHFVL
jgi:hypothetical protein